MKEELIYHINETVCINCGSCRRFCPVNTITYTHFQHQVNMEQCIGCTICYAVCPVEAVEVTAKAPQDRPVQLNAANMARVQARTLVKGPFYQYKRRMAQKEQHAANSTLPTS